MLCLAEKKEDFISKKAICHDVIARKKFAQPYPTHYMKDGVSVFSEGAFGYISEPVIQRAFDDEKKAKIPGQRALQLLRNIAKQHGIDFPILKTTPKDFERYYDVSQKYTERELAEILSRNELIRDQMLEQYPSARRDLEPVDSVEGDEAKVLFLQEIISKMMYYHTTRRQNVESIFENGLDPSLSPRDEGVSVAGISDRGKQATFKKWSKGWVFLTKNLVEASKYKRKFGLDGIILHIFADCVCDVPRLEIDVDSKGLKSQTKIDAVGNGETLNVSALALIREAAIYKGLPLEDNQYDNNLILTAYSNVCKQ